MGKRIVFLVIHLALGENEPKTTIKWLMEKKILIGIKSEKRTVQNVIHHWKTSSGDFFQNFSKSCSNHEENPFTCDNYEKGFVQNIPLNNHISSVHEGNRPYLCNDCNKTFEKKKLN